MEEKPSYKDIIVSIAFCLPVVAFAIGAIWYVFQDMYYNVFRGDGAAMFGFFNLLLAAGFMMLVLVSVIYGGRKQD